MRCGVLLCVFFWFPVFAQQNGELPIDWQHLEAHLTFQPQQKEVIGNVVLTFELSSDLDSAFIHGFKLEISEFLLNGKPLEYREGEGQKLYFSTASCSPRRKYTLEISYRAQPAMGLFFAGWDDTTETHVRQIYTHGQGNWHRRWMPLYDFPNDKYSTELNITFDTAYRVIANGYLTHTTIAGNQKTWRFEQPKPYPPYVIAFAVGKYQQEVIYTENSSTIDVYFYEGERYDEIPENFYQNTAELFEFIEQKVNHPYPWGPYSIIPVSDYTYGGMENAGVSFFNDRYFYAPSEQFLRVNAHEMAHQWFGNYITAQNDTHHWIQEGFATYFEWISNAEVLGDEWFLNKLFESEQAIVDAAFADSLPLADPLGSYERHYLRGAFTVHMLRSLIGERAFAKGLKRLMKKHAYGWANSTDVLSAFQKYTRVDLNKFRTQWIEKPGAPVFRLGVRENGNRRALAAEGVRVRDWHDAAYDMDISVHFYSGENLLHKTEIPIRGGTGMIDFPAEATHFEIDPMNTCMAYFIDLSPVEMRVNCALYSDNPIIAYHQFERLVARQELLSTDSILAIRLLNHPSQIARKLAIEPILKSGLLDTDRVTSTLLYDEHKDVVMSAIRAIDEWTEEVEKRSDQLLTGNSPLDMKIALVRKKYELTRDLSALRNWDSLSSRSHGLSRIEFLEYAYKYPGIFDRDEIRSEIEYYCSPAVNSYERELALDVALIWGEFNLNIVRFAQNATENSARQLRQKAKLFLAEMEDRFPDQMRNL